MSQLVITVPADGADWGPVQPVGTLGCMQTCIVTQADRFVCRITVAWNTPAPETPVISFMDGRQGGDRD